MVLTKLSDRHMTIVPRSYLSLFENFTKKRKMFSMTQCEKRPAPERGWADGEPPATCESELRPPSSGRARCRRGAATEPRVRVQLYFRAIGVAIDVPVWLPRPVVDLKICMYDRMYQDSVLVHTR